MKISSTDASGLCFDVISRRVNGEDVESIGPNINAFVEILSANFEPITHNSTLYIAGDDCLYRENKGEAQSFIQTVCVSAGYNKPIESLKRELIGRLRDLTVLPEYPFNKYPGFPCGNGVVVFGADGLKLVPYRSDMRYTYKIPTEYHEDANEAPAKALIDAWVEGQNDKQILYQIPAQAILQALPGREPSKKAYLIMGESNGGKSSYISLLSRLFNGKRNFSGVSLQTMGSTDSFWKNSLVGKLMNVCDDLQAVPLDSTECLKQVTGIREHEVNPKGKDRYMAELTAVHVFTCNRPPKIKGDAETDDAFWGRWEYTVFPYTFAKIDGWDEATFTRELLEGYLLSVLNCASIMMQTNSLLIRSEPSDVKEMWTTDSTPLFTYLSENTERADDNAWIYTEDLLTQLHRWRDEPELTEAERLHRLRRTPSTLTALSQAMLRQGYNTRIIQRLGKRRKAYVGIRWKPGALYTLTTTKNTTIG